MCWGDGRAKRNLRVSWLITCKEARAVRRHLGQRGPPPSELMSHVIQKGCGCHSGHKTCTHTCTGPGVRHTLRVPLLSLAQRRAGTRPGPPSKVTGVGNELRIPNGGCQTAQKILGTRGRIQPHHQIGQYPGVAGRPRALGWRTRGRAETRPMCPGLGHKRGALDDTESPVRSGMAMTTAGPHSGGGVPAPLPPKSRPRLRALSQASTLCRVGR